MSVINPNIDKKITYQGIEYIVTDVMPPDELMVKSVENPKKVNLIKIADLIKEAQFSTGETKELIDVDDKDFTVASKRFEIIKPCLELTKRTALDVKKRAKECKVSTSSIYRWISKYEKYGKVSALAPSMKNCGAKGKSRLSHEVDAILESAIANLYLHPQRYPLKTTYRDVVKKCIDADITPPHINSLRSRINSLSTKLIAKKRDRSSTRSTRGTPGSFPEAKMPLDVIQMDHTDMDVILVHEESREEIGRPYITVAIDVYSRMIAGFYISLNAPSFFGIGQCILQSILPKDDILAERGVKGKWPIFGIFMKLHTDNATEFRGEGLAKFVEEYRIELEHRPVARPEFGGYVERVIKTAMQEVHTIPGTTFSNLVEKANYDSQGQALLTISELEQWFTEYIVNIYHKTVHRSIGMTPEEKYLQGLYGVGNDAVPFLPQIPQDTLKLRLLMLPIKMRSVQKYGITIDYVTYFADVLRKWIRPAGYKRKKDEPVNFVCRRDPRDVSKIYFYDPLDKEYYVLPYRNIGNPAINLTELRQAIAEAQKRVTGREIEERDIFGAYERMQQIVEKASLAKKAARRQASAKKHMEKTLKRDNKLASVVEKPKVDTTVVNDFNDDDEIEYFDIEIIK